MFKEGHSLVDRSDPEICKRLAEIAVVLAPISPVPAPAPDARADKIIFLKMAAIILQNFSIP